MNADELKAGLEFDTLIAEWIEQKPYFVHPAATIIAREMSGEITYSKKRAWILTCNYGKGDIPVWMPCSFSENIAVAWKVVEKLVDEGHCPGLLFDDNGHWALPLEGAQNVTIGPDPQDIATTFFVNAVMWADTAPLAICHAVLGIIRNER